MPESRVAEIMTWTDEPELIRVAGELDPVFDPIDIAAARLVSAWEMGRMFNVGALS